MRIGTHLISSGETTPAQLQADAATAAAKGIASVWTNQQPGGWDPLVALAPMDGPREVGTAIVPTYPVHPVALATSALTVQALTGGRLTLGIGPSHAMAMTGWYGIPYTAPARHTREYLEVLRPLLRGEHVKYSGEFFTIDTALAIKADPPPVLIAALGPRMLRVARDLADGTIAVWVRPKTVADYLVPSLAEGARVVATVMVMITDDPDGLRETIARDYALVGELPAYRAILDRGGLSGPADTVIAGTESVVLQELQRFRDAGATDLILSVPGSRQDWERVLDLVTSA
jgi:F420-dependent oxidoreductase-like protein